MLSNKKGVIELVNIFAKKNIKYIVLSPGSRNAPLSLSFYNHTEFTVLIIPDERSAAYFALGMAQQLQKPVAICCTSGTAALNYAPAIAEAYYQKIPLIVITADRPDAWIDQADGQTIRQENMYYNYIKASYRINGDAEQPDDLWYVNRTVNEAIEKSLKPASGPVHINVSLNEPLYKKTNNLNPPVRVISTVKKEYNIHPEDLNELKHKWQNSGKKIILCGLLYPDDELKNILLTISQNSKTVVLTETTSNLNSKKFINCIDRTIDNIEKNIAEYYRPDLLITIGNPVISKKIKAFFRCYKPKEHWHIEENEELTDTYQSLTRFINISPKYFLKNFIQEHLTLADDFYTQWHKHSENNLIKHRQFLSKAEYCDLKVFEILSQKIPENSVVHLGNSSPVRYMQLFDQKENIHWHSNRGTSGIDGCTSTAAGAAYIQKNKFNILISGDIGFLYDSNALWNNYLLNNLRIIVINNKGGGIFRIIDRPETEEELQKLFETRHQLNFKKLVEAYGIDYRFANNTETLYNELDVFFEPSNKPIVLEIETPPDLNDKILSNYFAYINKQ